MSSLTASKKGLRARSLSLGGGGGGSKYFCYGKECHVRCLWEYCCSLGVSVHIKVKTLLEIFHFRTCVNF